MCLCAFRLAAFYWVPVVNPLEGTSGQLRFRLAVMPGSTSSNNLLGQFALTFRVANLEGTLMKHGPLLQAWARKPTEFILSLSVCWICVAKIQRSDAIRGQIGDPVVNNLLFLYCIWNYKQTKSDWRAKLRVSGTWEENFEETLWVSSRFLSFVCQEGLWLLQLR